MIEVKIFATFRIGREKSYSFDAQSVKTPRDICKALDINTDDVAMLIVNGFHSNPDVELKDGDTVSLFPPCAGG